jgi:CHAT domain-containing protein/tetratricopeptide (TPR) repeat protein
LLHVKKQRTSPLDSAGALRTVLIAMRRLTTSLFGAALAAVCFGAVGGAFQPVHAQPTTIGTAGRPLDTASVFDAGTMVRALTLAYDSGREEEAQKIWRRRAGRDAAARALLQGTIARLAYQLDDAERYYRAAAADTDGTVGAWAQLGSATIQVSKGGFPKAMEAFAATGVRMRALGDRHGLSEALLAQSLLALRVAGVDSAKALLRSASQSLPGDDPAAQARWQCVSLQIRTRGSERVADSTWRRVSDLVAPHGNRLRAECLFVRAQYVESLGNADRARALLDTVGILQDSARLWSGLSATRQWQGSSHLARGRYGLARTALSEARVYAKRGSSVGGEAWAVQELGRVAQAIGEMGDAFRNFTTARGLFLAAGDETGLVMADRTLAEAALLSRNLRVADSLYTALGGRLDRLVPQQRVPVLVARADLARQLGQTELGSQLLDSATATAQRRNSPGWAAEIRYQRGLVALANRRHRDAIAQWDTLLQLHPRLAGPAAFEVHMRWAEAHAGAGQFDDAWERFGLGKRGLDAWSRGFRRREDMLAVLQGRMFDWDRDLGIASIIARFAAAGRVPEALAMTEWRRVRAKEQMALQRGTLRIEGSNTVGTAVRVVDTAMLDARRLPALARGRLPVGTAVVSFAVGDGREPTTVFLLTRDTLISRILPPIDSLVDPIERFTAFLRAGRLQPTLAASLSEALLNPVLAVMPPHMQRLVIVPDGILHRLPFVALPGADGAPLLSHFEMVVSPSVEDALGSASSIARRSRGDMLLIGTPASMPSMPGDSVAWPPLPGARREIRVVRDLIRHSAVLDGRRAVRSTLSERLATGGRVLHVATHAATNPESASGTGFVITPSADDVEPGLFDLPALSAQPLPFDLVVLSACSSADGVLFSGQALHGLVSTALDTGARGVVATRWRLDDSAIVPYVEQFYNELLRGNDVVTALHRVRRSALADGASPALWANLEYFGDPTLQVELERRERSVWRRVADAMRQWLR